MADTADAMDVHPFMEGLSRIDRALDDSGYAFTALDVVVRRYKETYHQVGHQHLEHL